MTKKRPHDDEPLESPKSLKKAKTSGSLSTTSKPLIDAESEAKKMAKFAAKNPELYKRLQKDNLVGGVPLTAEQSRVEEDDDERDMKRYAKLLGLKTKDKNSNKKKLPAAFRRDGFADIFEGLGEFEVAEDAEGAGGDGDAAGEEAEDMFGEDSESDEAGFSEGEEDEEEGSEGDELDIQGDSDPESDELSFGSDDDQGSSDEEDGVFEDAEEDAEEDGLGGDSDEDEQGSDSEDDAESANGDALGESEDETPKAAAQPAPKATGAYVPPHLRAKDPKQSEQYQRLKRHLRGQLNRLTDSNMESIFNVAEEAYRQNPRHDVTEIVTDSLLDFVVDSASLLESFVLTQASFVALIHNILGIDVASNIAESAIRRFLEAYEKQKEVEEDEQRDKVCLNLITLISYLYNIKVLSCVVIYDLIREFISSLRTLDVELLLRVLRVSGYHLRSDDPTSLKDIVLEVQSKAKDREKGPNSFRLDFMIETIIDLKNNKRKLSGTNSGEDLERLRKFVQNMTKKRLAMGSEALRFGLKDLREADKKGKWWITGAAWVGRESTGPADTAGGDSGDSPAAANEALLALARKVNMNTDVRRNIFVVLMSSEDYADAVEKLLKLKLKDKQDREIARVIVLCAAQERVHNPYYELVAARFCNLNHGFKITFQYVLWDEIKTVADADVRRINNVAKLYGHLVAVRALSISVLKVGSSSGEPSPSRFMSLTLFDPTGRSVRDPDDQTDPLSPHSFPRRARAPDSQLS